VVGILAPTVIGELLGKVSAALSLPSEVPAPDPGDPPVGAVGDPPAATPAAAEDDH
jgi:hypothetical protein